MVCRSCNQKAQDINQDDPESWLSQEEVKSICEPCYESMVKHSITRIRKKVLLEKIGNKKMKFYEVIYKGPQGSKMNFGSYSLEPLCPQYLTNTEMPISVKDAKNMPNIQITEVELESRPSTEDMKAKEAKIKGLKGVMWVGASPKRVNEFGTFVKNVANWDVSPSGVEALRRNASFKIIE